MAAWPSSRSNQLETPGYYRPSKAFTDFERRARRSLAVRARMTRRRCALLLRAKALGRSFRLVFSTRLANEMVLESEPATSSASAHSKRNSGSFENLVCTPSCLYRTNAFPYCPALKSLAAATRRDCPEDADRSDATASMVATPAAAPGAGAPKPFLFGAARSRPLRAMAAGMGDNDLLVRRLRRLPPPRAMRPLPTTPRSAAPVRRPRPPTDSTFCLERPSKIEAFGAGDSVFFFSRRFPCPRAALSAADNRSLLSSSIPPDTEPSDSSCSLTGLPDEASFMATDPFLTEDRLCGDSPRR